MMSYSEGDRLDGEQYYSIGRLGSHRSRNRDETFSTRLEESSGLRQAAFALFRAPGALLDFTGSCILKPPSVSPCSFVSTSNGPTSCESLYFPRLQDCF